MTEEACGHCKYFKRRIDLMTEGQCRRYPGSVMPMPAPGGKIQLATLTPNKHQDDWCGDFARKVTLQ